MNNRAKVVLGSLVGALSVHGALIACGGSSGGSSEMSDAFVDAILDAVSMEASEAAADDAPASASSLVTVGVNVPKNVVTTVVEGPIVITDLVSIDIVKVFIADGPCPGSPSAVSFGPTHILMGITGNDSIQIENTLQIHGARMYVKAGQTVCASSTLTTNLSAFGFRPTP
jgi:hypothetical protein